MTDITYLHISGVLDENGIYRARPGHESPRRGRPLTGNPAYQLVLLDGDGRVLLSVAPQVTLRGCGSPDDPQPRGVRGVLPLRPDADAYELRQGEIRLYRAPIPAAPPAIAHATCHERAGTLALQWHHSAWHLAPARPVTYRVVVAMESGRRITVAHGLKDPSHDVDLSTLPVAGKGTVYVVATDGVRSSEVKATDIVVPARPPRMHILAPLAGGGPIPYGQALSMLGCCLDMSGQPCEPEHLAWYLDGERISSGTVLAAHDGLPPGSHLVTFAHEAPGTERVEASVIIQVDEPDEHHRQWQTLVGAGLPAHPDARPY